MSTLQAIERAARSLPRDKQEHLLSLLSAIVREEPRQESSALASAVDESSERPLHPELKAITGIIPLEAAAEDVHLYRLLTHS